MLEGYVHVHEKKAKESLKSERMTRNFQRQFSKRKYVHSFGDLLSGTLLCGTNLLHTLLVFNDSLWVMAETVLILAGALTQNETQAQRQIDLISVLPAHSTSFVVPIPLPIQSNVWYEQ